MASLRAFHRNGYTDDMILGTLYQDIENAWNIYMESFDFDKFPPDNFKHVFLNMTNNIYKDTEFFVRATIESHLMLTDKSLLDFEELSSAILSPKRKSIINPKE